METRKTAVFVSAHHLYAGAWDDVMWGDPAVDRYGRVSRGLVEALRWDADMINFGTGSSERDGKIEAEVIYELALSRIGSLAAFSGLDDPQSWLKARAVVDTVTQDTRGEISAALKVAHERGIERIVLVSSPTHIFRAHQNALSLIDAEPAYKHFKHELYAVASDVSYEGSTVDDVTIVEPPHRADRPRVPFHATAKCIFAFLKDEDTALRFNTAWNALIDEWLKKLP